MPAIKHIFFDVANTLLHKPLLFERIGQSLAQQNIHVPVEEIRKKHKLLSELIKFPDRTSREFYHHFNSELLLMLGIAPSQELVLRIYESCSYLEWKPFTDLEVLERADVGKSIISNWDTTLMKKIGDFFPRKFSHVISSEAAGFSKPDTRIFELALKQAGVGPQEAIYVGDSIRLDFVPAHAMGIHAFLIDRDDVYSHFQHQRILSLNELNNFIG